MSGYYQLPELEQMQQGSAEELEMRLLGRLQQVCELATVCIRSSPRPDPPKHRHRIFLLWFQEALRRLRPVRLKLELQPVAAPASSNGRPSSAGSSADGSAGHQAPGLPPAALTPPRRSITGLHIRRKLALASKHPFGKLTSFGRRLDQRIQTCQESVLYEVRGSAFSECRTA